MKLYGAKMTNYSKELIGKTKEVFQPYSEILLSDEDAIEIINNTANLLKILIKLDQKYA